MCPQAVAVVAEQEQVLELKVQVRQPWSDICVHETRTDTDELRTRPRRPKGLADISWAKPSAKECAVLDTVEAPKSLHVEFPCSFRVWCLGATVTAVAQASQHCLTLSLICVVRFRTGWQFADLQPREEEVTFGSNACLVSRSEPEGWAEHICNECRQKFNFQAICG